LYSQGTAEKQPLLAEAVIPEKKYSALLVDDKTQLGTLQNTTKCRAHIFSLNL